MSLLATDAIVLHCFDYLESSRIFRMLTREAGVQSVLARGARSSRARFGTGLGLFASGVAHISFRDGRELQTLTSFELIDARPGVAADYSRFLGASAIAELVLRFGISEGSEELFCTVDASLASIATAPLRALRNGSSDSDLPAVVATLRAAWQVVASLGFTPTLEDCSVCHAHISLAGDATFAHRTGGVLCSNCARGEAVAGARKLPPEARRALLTWIAADSDDGATLGVPDTRAHIRLLREFVQEHLADSRPLTAFEIWESSA